MNGICNNGTSSLAKRGANRGLETLVRGSDSTHSATRRRRRKAIQLLPAYINRGIVDREAVRDITKKAETLEGALSSLAQLLDPPMDTFTAMQEVNRLNWQLGQDIADYFFTLKRKATYASLGLKHVASLLASELPRDIQTRIKTEVAGINDSLEHEDAHKLIRTVRNELTEKGYALDKGNRNFAAVSKVALARNDDQAEEINSIETPERVAYTRGPENTYRTKPKFKPRPVEGCFICGGRHAWRFCPDKRCPACGQKGHFLKDCPTDRSDGNKRKVMRTGDGRSQGELAAALLVKLNGRSISALVDSGAGPSVIDIETVHNLGLEPELVNKPGRIFGLSKDPVKVVGTLELTLDLGNGQILDHAFEVLSGAQSTCILGRDLLAKFGVTEFNWENNRVHISEEWKDSQFTIEGGGPLMRAHMSRTMDLKESEPNYIFEIRGDNEQEQKFDVNPYLTNAQKDELFKLLHEHSDVFAINPKSPSVARGVSHIIDIGGAQPVKQRSYPVAPAVEQEIMEQVREMVSNQICRPSNSPWASRVLLVTKRNGSKRFCVDFRELNKVTRADSYPMPHPKDILDKMHGDSYYSFLDGASAYWAIEIKEEDRYKTAFTTLKGLFEFNRMPFGLINSGSTYQR